MRTLCLVYQEKRTHIQLKQKTAHLSIKEK